jgi:hypothetical protein
MRLAPLGAFDAMVFASTVRFMATLRSHVEGWSRREPSLCAVPAGAEKTNGAWRRLLVLRFRTTRSTRITSCSAGVSPFRVGRQFFSESTA